jgi:phosphoglycerol transferase MdoB-like AlkP superfamily enzyme
MDFMLMFENFISMAQANLPIFLAAAALIILLLYKNPKLGMIVILIALVLSVVFYLITSISTTGVSSKSKLNTMKRVDN